MADRMDKIVQTTPVEIAEPVSIDDNGGSITVDGPLTDAELRASPVPVDITIGDEIEVNQPTHDSLNANANIQIGDADVGAGNPVPVSDNGGSLTVDGSVSVSNLTASGQMDAGNTTSTPLGGGASFVGTSFDTSEYSGAIVEVYADQDGSFALETSDDDTNWDHGHTYAYVGGGARHYTFQLPGQYARINYTNGATPQGTFRLSTKFVKSTGFTHDHPIDAAIDDNHPSAVTRAVLTAKCADGNYCNIKGEGIAFQTNALLTNGQTYDSGILDLRGYTQVQTQVLSDVDGTWVADFIRDSGGTDILRTLTVPHTGSANMLTFAAPAFTDYVRYRFTADAAGQSDFYFDTSFLTGAISPQILNVEAFVSPLMTSSLNRSVSMGKDPKGVFTNERLGGLAFNTTTPLANGATYDSGVLDLLGYSQVQTHIFADQDGTINIYWYTDSAGTDQVRLLTIPYVASTGFQTFAAPAFTPYVKYTFTNDSGSPQTDFHFDTKFLTKAISAQILTPSGTIANQMTAALTRSIIAGETSGGGGGYVNVKVNPSGTLEVNANQGNHDDFNANANIQVGDVDVSNGNPVPMSDAGGSITIDNTAIDTNIDTPLSTLETSLNAINSAQLADGHNVTIDNAGGVSAVNIQDGGNSITVDGTVTADAGTGPWPVTDNGGSLTVDGSVSVSNLLPDGHNVTVDNAAGASAVNIQDGGNSITVDGTVAATQSGTWNTNVKTVLSKSGSVSASGGNTVISAGTNKLKVFAMQLYTTSTTAVTCIFKDGAAGSEIYRVVLQAPSDAVSGAVVNVNPPAWLFNTSAATLLELDLSSAQTVHYSFSYFDEA